ISSTRSNRRANLRLFRKKGVKQETPDCTLDFKEFVERMAEHESSLTLVFNEIDVNKDGTLEP
uniref:EF-hand domain-containing protein n=1 Tax=Romanomermis culicivorax TaxID=13658 RepID=A0A915KUB4_ROMCU